MKRCLDCGSIGEWGRGGRCEQHRLELQRARERHPARRGRKQQLYTADHRRVRAAWVRVLLAGDVVTCPRCTGAITYADPWDLGHQSDGSLHPEHQSCNRSYGATHERGAHA